MTREDLFRAVGEVREDQITDADTKRKPRTMPWRRYGAAAACLAVLLAGGAALGQLLHHTGADLGESEVNAGDMGSGVDGSDYSIAQDAPAGPVYSVDVEIGELDSRDVGDDQETTMDAASCLAWLEPEEILARDTVIFRGTVRDLRCFQVQARRSTMYYTVASVEVTDCVRGGLAEGDIYNVLYEGAAGWMTTSVSGDLAELETGSDAVFMPYVATEDTGWREGDSYFCYADLAELYFSEGMRFLFLDTGEGLSFQRNVYADIASAETLDEVMDYLRKAVPHADET